MSLSEELARLDRMLLGHAGRRTSRAPAPEWLAVLTELAGEHARPIEELPAELMPAPSLPGLVRAGELFGLVTFDLEVLLLALAAEHDARYGRVFASLNEQPGRPRPSVGLAMALFGERLERFLPEAPLRRFALIELEGEGPLPAKQLTIPADLWPRLAGLAVTEPKPLTAQRALASLELSAEVRADAERAVAWLRRHDGAGPLLVVRGPGGAGRKTLARALAAEAGLRVLSVGSDDDARRVARDARWYGAAVELGAMIEPGPMLDAVTGAVIAWGERHASGFAAAERPVHELVIPALGLDDRRRLWAAMLPDSQLDHAWLAGRFRFSPARIEATARLVASRIEGTDGTPALRDIEAVARELPVASFGGLAQRIACPYGLDDIVLAPGARSELELALLWARHGLDGAGGLVCCFHGPPGTGKTMAAQILAADLRLDLYRIDLSQVVNKYIGETEKQLDKVFEQAEAANAVLFFDEADALFGRRTEVRDAHDRYANVETGYLLQRLEMYSGIAILATNLRRNLDEAFLRRFHVVIELELPNERERRQIWERNLPELAARDRDVDVSFLSKFALAGGDIRNAARTAKVLSKAADGAVAMRHLAIGIHRELHKAGRIVDMKSFGRWAPLVEKLARGGALLELVR